MKTALAKALKKSVIGTRKKIDYVKEQHKKLGSQTEKDSSEAIKNPRCGFEGKKRGHQGCRDIKRH